MKGSVIVRITAVSDAVYLTVYGIVVRVRMPRQRLHFVLGGLALLFDLGHTSRCNHSELDRTDPPATKCGYYYRQPAPSYGYDLRIRRTLCIS
jgi:hypothetical protein